MQNFEPDPDPSFVDMIGLEFFIPIFVLMFVILLMVMLVKALMGGGSRSSSSKETEKESVKKSNMCKNCHYEPIYDKPSGLCRYCVKYV